MAKSSTPKPKGYQGVKCTAHKTNGDPCPNWAMRGQQVCGSHGGRSPQAKRAAKVRLAALIDPSILALDTLLKPASVKKHPAQALGAAKEVLDRTGYKPEDELTVTFRGGTIDPTKAAGMSNEELEAGLAFLRKIYAAPAKDDADRT